MSTAASMSSNPPVTVQGGGGGSFGSTAASCDLDQQAHTVALAHARTRLWRHTRRLRLVLHAQKAGDSLSSVLESGSVLISRVRGTAISFSSGPACIMSRVDLRAQKNGGQPCRHTGAMGAACQEGLVEAASSQRVGWSQIMRRKSTADVKRDSCRPTGTSGAICCRQMPAATAAL